jgi:hypothetical protein
MVSFNALAVPIMNIAEDLDGTFFYKYPNLLITRMRGLKYGKT